MCFRFNRLSGFYTSELKDGIINVYNGDDIIYQYQTDLPSNINFKKQFNFVYDPYNFVCAKFIDEECILVIRFNGEYDFYTKKIYF